MPKQYRVHPVTKSKEQWPNSGLMRDLSNIQGILHFMIRMRALKVLGPRAVLVKLDAGVRPTVIAIIAVLGSLYA